MEHNKKTQIAQTYFREIRQTKSEQSNHSNSLRWSHLCVFVHKHLSEEGG